MMKKRVLFCCEFVTDLVLGLWVGGAAMIMLSVFGIFGTLGKARRGVAGAVAGPIFDKFFLILLIAWLVMAAALLVKKLYVKPPSAGIQGMILLFVLLLMFAATVGEHCFILPKLEAIVAESGHGPEEAFPQGELHDQFMGWHGLSMAVMSLNLCLGVGAVALRRAEGCS